MLELIDVSVIYDPYTKFRKEALTNINLKIENNEAIAIVGQIGSGKSTLIQLLNGILKPDKGRVILDGVDINDRRVKRKEIIKKIGVVFQSPEDQFFAETVFDEVAFGPKNLGFSKEEIEERVNRALLSMGLIPESLSSRSPFSLSGGEKRRVAIASIISINPQIIVLDEPTAGMDFSGKISILAHIKDQLHKGVGVVFITHNMEEAIQIADRLIVLSEGRIVFDGEPKAFFINVDFVKKVGLDIPFPVEFRERAKKQFPDFPFCRDSKEIIKYFLSRKKQ